MLGNNICGTRFSFHVDLRLGAGAFVCGEETALIVIDRRQAGNAAPATALSRARGALRRAHAHQQRRDLCQHSSHHSATGETGTRSIGTEKSKGTKVFALAGRIGNTGLIEVPMGITLREIVFEIGGGIPEGRKFKAVQTGGPSGGCIPAEFLDMPVDYESLARARIHHGFGRHDRDG